MGRRVLTSLAALAAGVVLFAPPIRAQMRGRQGPAARPQRNYPFHFSSGPGRLRHGRGRVRRRPFRGATPYLYGGGYYGGFYCDYGYDCGPEAPAQPPEHPPAAPRKTPSAPPAQAAPAPPPAKPLVLEYRDNQWVRVGEYGLTTEVPPPAPKGFARTFEEKPAATSTAKEARPSKPLPPVVLVFRDGRREQVEQYTIIGPAIYTTSNYYRTGSWTRKILISELNVPETLKLNQERGAKFSLPTGPNEIVVRP